MKCKEVRFGEHLKKGDIWIDNYGIRLCNRSIDTLFSNGEFVQFHNLHIREGNRITIYTPPILTGTRIARKASK